MNYYMKKKTKKKGRQKCRTCGELDEKENCEILEALFNIT